MLNTVPLYVTIIFIATTILTFVLFLKAANKNGTVAIICVAWLVFNAALSLNGFYKDTLALPPHFLLATIPAVIAVLVTVFSKKGKKFVANLDIKALTLLSVVRIPVEFCLYWLYQSKAVPQLMTFEGRNFDIVSGITAIIVYFICFKGKTVVRRKLLMAWNIIALLLLLNIVINAVLSLPLQFQQFAFDQPNIAVLYFPFVWLPCFIVMVVLFSHLASIKKLTTI